MTGLASHFEVPLTERQIAVALLVQDVWAEAVAPAIQRIRSAAGALTTGMPEDPDTVRKTLLDIARNARRAAQTVAEWRRLEGALFEVASHGRGGRDDAARP